MGKKDTAPELSDKKAMRLRKEAIELRQAEVDLALDEIRLETYSEERRWKAHDDRNHGRFVLDGSVGGKCVDLATQIQQYGRANPGSPITLTIFSGGGSVFHGLVLYDTLRTLAEQDHLVTTVVRGYAASMAGLIFLAGDNRLIGAESQVMIHSLSAGTGGSLHEMEDDVEFYRRLDRRLNGIYVKRTKVTQDMLDKKTKKKDWWVTAEEAKKLKIATAIG